MNHFAAKNRTLHVLVVFGECAGYAQCGSVSNLRDFKNF